jgi:hypothetical protein
MAAERSSLATFCCSFISSTRLEASREFSLTRWCKSQHVCDRHRLERGIGWTREREREVQSKAHTANQNNGSCFLTPRIKFFYYHRFAFTICWCSTCTFVNNCCGGKELRHNVLRLSQTILKLIAMRVCLVSFRFLCERSERNRKLFEWIVNESTGQQRTLLVGYSREREMWGSLCVKTKRRNFNELIRMGRKRLSFVLKEHFSRFLTCSEWSVNHCGGWDWVVDCRGIETSSICNPFHWSVAFERW